MCPDLNHKRNGQGMTVLRTAALAPISWAK